MDSKEKDILVNTDKNFIRENMPEIFKILLIDRTMTGSKKTKNIIWANENYIEYGKEKYSPTSQIKPELVTGKVGEIIKPRAKKSLETQKQRTKEKAEVFTPTWIIKLQVDEVDKNYENDDLETYTKRTWLEIACGEGPYIASRYDMITGQKIEIKDRVGFLDRKLRRINKEVNDKAEWQRLVLDAYKSGYGFEWSGDSLLLARENLLYTYIDYYIEKWQEEPTLGLLEDIAIIISYNIFQMDGLNYTIPLSEKMEKLDDQVDLFKLVDNKENSNKGVYIFNKDEIEEKWEVVPGKRVKIMNWTTMKMEFFDKGVK